MNKTAAGLEREALLITIKDWTDLRDHVLEAKANMISNNPCGIGFALSHVVDAVIDIELKRKGIAGDGK